MNWQTAFTIILSIISVHAVMLGLVAWFLNKRINNLNENTNRRLDRIEKEIREIRQLLYKFLEVPKGT